MMWNPFFVEYFIRDRERSLRAAAARGSYPEAERASVRWRTLQREKRNRRADARTDVDRAA
jgi:hypothetical protein